MSSAARFYFVIENLYSNRLLGCVFSLFRGTVGLSQDQIERASTARQQTTFREVALVRVILFFYLFKMILLKKDVAPQRCILGRPAGPLLGQKKKEK